MSSSGDSLFRALFDRGPDAVLVADDEGLIVDVNPAAEKLLRRPRESIVGSTVIAIVAGDEVDTNERWAHFADKGSQRGELMLRRGDGTTLPVEYSAVRNVLPGLHASLLRDITGRRESERFRDELLATVSHELRTPLQAILGWASLLRDADDRTELVRGLERIEANARTQARLVEDLLDLSRLAQGRMRLERRSVGVSKLVSDGVEAAAERARTKSVEIDVLIDANVGGVHVDPHRMQQVVWNLTTNAVKFTPQGGKVRVRVRRVMDAVCIEVKDNGIGIASEDLETLFEPFRQVGTSRQSEGGLGLGLAISKRLVELHGGQIEVESAGRGKGSVFRVVLPSAATSDDAHDERERKIEPRVLGGLRILLCDDDLDTLDVLTRVLTRHGAEVTAVSSADKAMEVLRERALLPDILVSDLAMPHRDGLALVGDLRALPSEEGGTLPAVALTAYARAIDARRALEAGFDAYLPKPVPTETLVATLRGLVTASR